MTTSPEAARLKLTEREIKARRELVLTHLSEIMKSVGTGPPKDPLETRLDMSVPRPAQPAKLNDLLRTYLHI